MKWVPCKIDR
jgi:hypothetical protein